MYAATFGDLEFIKYLYGMWYVAMMCNIIGLLMSVVIMIMAHLAHWSQFMVVGITCVAVIQVWPTLWFFGYLTAGYRYSTFEKFSLGAMVYILAVYCTVIITTYAFPKIRRHMTRYNEIMRRMALLQHRN